MFEFKDYHYALYKELAEFHGAEAAMVYVSGYHVNIGVYNTLAGEKDVIFSDALNHASIIDGLKLSKAKKVIFKHNDLKDLENKLKKAKNF